MDLPFQKEELPLLVASVLKVVSELRGLHTKSEREVEGEIFTALRRELQRHHQYLFRGGLKSAVWTEQRKWAFIEGVARNMLKEKETEEPTSADLLHEMKICLAAAQGLTIQLTSLNVSGESVIEKIKLLDSL